MRRSRGGRVVVFALGCAAASVARAQDHANLYVDDETVAFEDVLSSASDEDHNDVVVRYNKRCEVDGSGDLVEEMVHLVPLASGARRSNRLELRLPATPTSVERTVGGGPVEVLDPATDLPVVVLGDVAAEGFPTAGAGFVNTVRGATIHAGEPITIRATYPAGNGLGGSCAPADLAIARDDGTVVDRSTRLPANDQPAVAFLPGVFDVPRELQALSVAYPDFLTWVADEVDGCSGTCAAADWYTRPVPAEIVERSSLETTAPLAAQASCSDGVQNQDETGVDCGGDVCASCAPDGTEGHPATSCHQLHLDHPDLATGRYWLQTSAGTFEAWCDMDADDGGWTLILNYNHLAGTNPLLDVRSASLPIPSSTSLGADESGSAAWGHAGNGLLASLSFTESLWYCESSRHSRVIHFKTTSSTVHDYLRTGTGDAGGVFDPAYTVDMPLRVDATLPLHTNGEDSRYTNEGDFALTEFPFYSDSGIGNPRAHWGIRGLGGRWECDDQANSGSYHTYHQVWVR